MPKKKAVQKEDKSSTFVKIDEPIEIREQVLNAAIDATNLLKSFERNNLLRDKKLKHIRKVKIIMNKIEKEFKIMREDYLPKIDAVEKSIEKAEKKPTKKVSIPRAKKITEYKKTELDKEIDKIKDKLANLRV